MELLAAAEAEDEFLAQKFLDKGEFTTQALEDFVCQLRLRDQTRPQRLLDPGEMNKMSEGLAIVGLFDILDPGEMTEISEG